MVIYASTMTADKMDKARKYQVCAECGGPLAIFYDIGKSEHFLACWDWNRTHHEGIAKEYENRDYNIKARREFMNQEIGEQKTRALEKYSGITSLRKEEAREIIDTIWPKAGTASPAEVFKAVTICVQYGLNPLMKHVYLIPFWNKDTKGYDYVAVLGIGATRLVASRKHSYSYIDDTPRLMTEEEQKKTFGEFNPKNLVAVTILKDMKTGATARGYGFWPLKRKDWNDKTKQYEEVDNEPKGIEKGNSKANMAFIRSERQALDRLYPADMPKNVEVVDEQYEVTATVEPPTQTPATDAPAEEIKESAEVPPEAPPSPPTPDKPVPKTEEKATSDGTQAQKPPPETVADINMEWLNESLTKIGWNKGKVPAWRSWLKSKANYTGLNLDGTLEEVLNRMDKPQKEFFVKEIQSRLDMA